MKGSGFDHKYARDGTPAVASASNPEQVPRRIEEVSVGRWYGGRLWYLSFQH